AMLWAAYGIQPARSRTNGSGVASLHRTVPSGGALFPLQLHLMNLIALPELSRATYAVEYSRDGAVGLRRVGDISSAVYRAYADPSLVRQAQAVIVLSGDIEVTARKYGNRAVLYVALEAGHAAQNVLLSAAQLRVGALEIGGFMEGRLRSLLGGARRLTPLTTIAVGGAQPSATPPVHSPEIEFNWIEFNGSEARPGHELGMATFADTKHAHDAAWGRDPDPLLAYDKAVAEA